MKPLRPPWSLFVAPAEPELLRRQETVLIVLNLTVLSGIAVTYLVFGAVGMAGPPGRVFFAVLMSWFLVQTLALVWLVGGAGTTRGGPLAAWAERQVPRVREEGGRGGLRRGREPLPGRFAGRADPRGDARRRHQEAGRRAEGRREGRRGQDDEPRLPEVLGLFQPEGQVHPRRLTNPPPACGRPASGGRASRPSTAPRRT